METSPSRHVPYLPPPNATINPPSSSPRSTRTLRKLQSAQTLSSNYAAANAPGLISQQRQLQHRSSGLLRESSATQNPPPPPQSHGRSRSNSDIATTGIVPNAPGPRRIPKKTNGAADANSKDDLETLVRQGTKGDAMGSLDKLRRLVLLDGVDADSDGMVSILLDILTATSIQLINTTTVSFANLHLVNSPQRSAAFNRYLPLSHSSRPFSSLLENP